MKAHFVEQDGLLVAFFPDTRRIFCVNEKAKLLVESIENGKNKEEVMSEFNISEDQYRMYCEKIFPKNTRLLNASEFRLEKNLSRLVIHLTNDCNMRCKYCYANGGRYSSERDILKKETLDTILRVFYNKFEKIYSVQFFGGEPLLNVHLLEYACKEIRRISRSRNYDTYFGIVTNATLIDEKFVELVNEYNIHVTVSYDGNPKVNNLMRCMEDGAPSTDIILKKAKMLKTKTGQPETIEVTYNKFHVLNSVGIIDIIKHIQKEIPNTYVHLVPAGGDEQCNYALKDLSIFKKSIKEVFLYNSLKNRENEILTYSLAQRIINALKNKEYKSEMICDAGIGTISVTTNGDIYPCFMFTDNPKMKYGSIWEENLFDSDQYHNLRNTLDNFLFKDKNEKCQNCFIKYICNSCLGLSSYHSGDPFVLSEDICNMFRDMTEAAIVEFAKMYKQTNEK